MFGSKKTKEPTPAPPAAKTPAEPKPAPAAADAAPARSIGGGADAATAAGEPRSREEAQRAAVAIRQSVAFAQIVSVLMHSPHYKHYTLADLEWLVVPPLLAGQFSLAEAKGQADGPSFPVAVALWASVSRDVDQRLTENPVAPIRLRPDEWRSGDILWLVDAVGDGRIVPQFLKQLAETVLKGKDVKVRRLGADGKPAIQTLSAAISAAGPTG